MLNNSNLIGLIYIDDSLRSVTHYEDHHHPRQQGYHGLVLPVGQHDDGDYSNISISPLGLTHLVVDKGVLLHGLDDLVVNEGEQEDGDDP